MDNLVIVGTSHVSSESAKAVKKAIEDYSPEVVAVELDQGRAYALTHNLKRPKNSQLLKELGLGGFLFYVIGEFIQKRIGKVLDFEPGSEMLTAMREAKKRGLPVALIDRDIRITLKRFSKHFRKREILKLIWDSFTMKGRSFDLHKAPDDELITYVLKMTRTRYPSLHKILIDERDRIMAHRLWHLCQEKRVVAVVGAGHLPGIKNYLSTNFK